MENYRNKLYQNYGKNIQDAPLKFDEHKSSRWGKAQLYYLKNWMPNNKNANIIDVACGGGKLLHFFVVNGYQNIKGIDISNDQVELSKQVTSNVIKGDIIEYLENNPNCFDLITGYDIIEHFYKDEVIRFLNAACSALQPGGRLIIQTPNAESIWGTHHRYNCFTHETCFNPNSLKRIMQLAGFTNIEAKECLPPPYGYSISSSIRYVFWKIISVFLKFYNLVETGSLGSGIYTRIFLISGQKNE